MAEIEAEILAEEEILGKYREPWGMQGGKVQMLAAWCRVTVPMGTELLVVTGSEDAFLALRQSWVCRKQMGGWLSGEGHLLC